MQTGQPLTANIDPGEVLKSAAVGAVAGAVNAATMGAATAVMGTGAAATFGGTVASGVVSSVVSGQAARATDNLLSGNGLTSGLGNPVDMVNDAVAGGLGAAAAFGLGKLVSSAGEFLEGGCKSFSADTLVLTDSGLVPISSLHEGDLVVAFDDGIKATGLYTVTAVMTSHDPEVTPDHRRQAHHSHRWQRCDRLRRRLL